ncbi:MAG: THUMP domain-containing protein [Ignisphaera sp.]|nr:THUMP domain-containing protein [Ignisphaera sp.]MDW8084791.1 THUMP domain-containing protein [Ignisphaera sp.]
MPDADHGPWQLLVRYCEVALKSTTSRLRMEGRLVRNIGDALKLSGVDAKVWASDARVWVCCFSSESEAMYASGVVARVMGVASVSPVVTVGFRDVGELVDAAKKYFAPRVKGRMFAVRVRRRGSHSFTSRDVERLLGKVLLEMGGRGVDLEAPEITAFVEIRGSTAHLFDRVIRGPGGLPIGVEGKVLGIILNGIYSLAAVWMVMKRGCEADLLLLDVDTSYTERIVSLVKRFADRWMYGYRPKLHIVNARRILTVMSTGALDLHPLITRKVVVEVARTVAQEVGADAIVFDEFLEPSSLYILTNVASIDVGEGPPILRPLIAMGRDEVSRVLERIGLKELIPEEYSIYSALEPRGSRVANVEDADSVKKGLAQAIECARSYAVGRGEYDLRTLTRRVSVYC